MTLAVADDFTMGGDIHQGNFVTLRDMLDERHRRESGRRLSRDR
jgi:hypothetical protein